MIEVEIANSQSLLPVDDARLQSAVRQVLAGEGVAAAEISLAVVDDATIGELNYRYLQHDNATDVLSFLLESTADRLEGEVIVSAETATATAPDYGWTPQDELLLYVIHGLLHLVGYDDHVSDESEKMRERERHYLSALGIRSPAAVPSEAGGTCTGEHNP